MSLSRRQFLVALGAEVVGGTQLERVATFGDQRDRTWDWSVPA